MVKLTLDAEQQIQADTARTFVSSEFEGNVGVLDIEATRKKTREAWQKMADLGWLGICVPEEYGGIGLGLLDLSIVFEALGTELVTTPMLSTVALSAETLARFGTDEQKEQWLPAIADGSAIISFGFQEGPAFDITNVATSAEANGSDYVLNGEKTLVLDAPSAAALIVSARTAPLTDETSGISLFIVPKDTTGLAVEQQELIDGRVAAKVSLQNVVVPGTALIGTLGAGDIALRATIDRATIMLCAEMLGGMQRVFQRTVDYLSEREQFGVKIGTFQALQHKAARMYVALTLARPTVRAAATTDAEENLADYQKAVSHAKVMCADAYLKIAGDAIQLHGGVGMTEEFGIGRYLRAAAVAETMFGDRSWHKARWAGLSGY